MIEKFLWPYVVQPEQTLLAGEQGEVGPLYTRLLVTAADGPHHGNIFLTAELYRNVGVRGPAFPIWKSTDNGGHWLRMADVVDQRFEFGNRYQPSLYELPRQFSGYDRGTLLLVGNAIPDDLSSTHLVMYASTTGGESWEFVSLIDEGGPALYDPSAIAETTAIWEPNLTMVGDNLICFYADERFKHDGMLQTLVHRSTRDLRNWSEPVLDFGVDDLHTRPGMFVTTGELPDCTYRGVFELVGPQGVPVHFMTSSDGISWGPAGDVGHLLQGESGTVLSGSPCIAWRSTSQGNVELLVTGRISLELDGTVTNCALFNAEAGQGKWYEVPLPVVAVRDFAGENSGYSQSVAWALDGSIIHATTVKNSLGSHDIVVGRAEPMQIGRGKLDG